MSTKKKVTKKKATKNLICLGECDDISIYLEKVNDYIPLNLDISIQQMVIYYLQNAIGIDVEWYPESDSTSFYLCEMSIEDVSSDHIHER